MHAQTVLQVRPCVLARACPRTHAGLKGAALDAAKRAARLLASRVAHIVTLPHRRLGSVSAALHWACVAPLAVWGGACVCKAGLGQALDRERVLSTVTHSFLHWQVGEGAHRGACRVVRRGEQGAPPAACGQWGAHGDPLPRSPSKLDFLVMLCQFAANSLLACFWSASGAANAPNTHRFVSVVGFGVCALLWSW